MGGGHLRVRWRQHRRGLQSASPAAIWRATGRTAVWVAAQPRFAAAPSRNRAAPYPKVSVPAEANSAAFLLEPDQVLAAFELLTPIPRSARTTVAVSVHLASHGRQYSRLGDNGAAATCAGPHEVVLRGRRGSCTTSAGQRFERCAPAVQAPSEFSHVVVRAAWDSQPWSRFRADFDAELLCINLSAQHDRWPDPAAQLPSASDERRHASGQAGRSATGGPGALAEKLSQPAPITQTAPVPVPISPAVGGKGAKRPRLCAHPINVSSLSTESTGPVSRSPCGLNEPSLPTITAVIGGPAVLHRAGTDKSRYGR